MNENCSFKLYLINNNYLNVLAQNAFLKLGKQLKIRRLNDYIGRWESMVTEKDPAEDNPEIKRKLEESNKKFHADMDAVINIFNYIKVVK